MAISEKKQVEPASSGPTEEERQSAANVIAGLQLARKTYSLYAEDHINCKRAMERFWLQLGTYLQAHGNLRFELGRDRLIFKGEVIFSEPAEDGSLPFTLFRDGIQWVEFQDGIEAREVEEFLRILNKYRILTDEPDGDLVTAIWEARLPHIKYNVTDFFWGAETEGDFAPAPKREEKDSPLDQEDEQEASESESITSIDPAMLEITPEEEAELQQMVRLEEKRNPSAEYLNAMLDTLLEYREEENYTSVLGALETAYHDSLAKGDFTVTLKILKGLHYVHKICESETNWAVPLIDNFLLTASSSQSLRPLQMAWSDVDTTQIGKIREILMALKPEAIHTLGGILLQTQSLMLQKMLTDVILSLASRDLKPLVAMLGRPEEDLVRRLVSVLGLMDGERPTQILARMVRHSSASVREEAVKALLNRGPTSIRGLFHLIEDQSESVRRLVLRHMAKERNNVAEALLLGYLEKGEMERADEKHIIDCFRTLGRCGSARSIPFLRQTLIGRSWLPNLRSSAYRKGAALALGAMKMNGGWQVLEDASRSLKPGVRRLARKVMQGQTSPKEV